MKKDKVALFIAVGGAIALSIMGFCFCWHCPSRYYAPHALFWRQLAWHGIGLGLSGIAVVAGWKRLLKAAPWLMAAWVLAFVAAQFSPAINGAHRWVSVGPVRFNVMTCLVPVVALFVAWLHDRKLLKPWMEWSALAVVIAICGWMVLGNASRLERIAAFLNPGGWLQGKAYMAKQLQLAFYEAHWFGDAGRHLGYLPCPESDGMMSASALMFGKWFTVMAVALFSVLGGCLTVIWRAAGDVAKRRFTLVFGLWLVAPAVYCLLHSLALLPVVGVSPALLGYGGTLVAMTWLGLGGVIAAVVDESDLRREVPGKELGVVICGWVVLLVLSIAAIALAPGRESWAPHSHKTFAEPRPSDLTFGPFGLEAERGSILAADGMPLAYTIRHWVFHVDPISADIAVFNSDTIHKIADGLKVPVKNLLTAYMRTDASLGFQFICEMADELDISVDELLENNWNNDSISASPDRYIFLADVFDDSPELRFFQCHRTWLTRRCGIICEPIQKRVYTLGAAATSITGFLHGGAYADKPCGAAGLECACDELLVGEDGIYDKSLPVKERYACATPKRGKDIQATIVPAVQKSVSDALVTACATNGAESAWAIVMNATNGNIVAMASWPCFDPSARRLLDTKDKEWTMEINHGATDCFEPGGLVKPLTYAIALDVQAITEGATITQEGGAWEYNGLTISDNITNKLTIAEAVAEGVNIAAGKTALTVGPEKSHAALKRFGFGSSTRTRGILGEGAGILPASPEAWLSDKTTAMRIGMGYGFAATGLQIAQAYATIANHGRIVRPHLILGETPAGGQAVSSVAADAIVAMLKKPVCSTVQISEKGNYLPDAYIASCVGFHPSDNPQYVVVVSFKKPHPAHTGEDVAKPAWVAIDHILGHE